MGNLSWVGYKRRMARGEFDSSSIHLFCEHTFDNRRDSVVVLRPHTMSEVASKLEDLTSRLLIL
ncbi:MAG: hypothetical protein WA364_21820, partial [Candidatus Nitrosopolaris sp.]